jgi:hypothetical protein
MQEHRGATTLSQLARRGQHAYNFPPEPACVVHHYAGHGVVWQQLPNCWKLVQTA